ncbi:maleylpyruvate isomerase N-terminal domain-containing protein, partial [Jatrophihabitans sp.]|uniref:maleylpyruvate isomerase N-terminal domain-containing protein n=1 Tax=Jatrophihabitans sp. TaxID=1932789 RepID=UPI0030C7249D
MSGLTDDQIARPSRLPNWTVGHVLSHLARNADGHSRRLEGALVGKDVPKYSGGRQQRANEIDDGAARPAADVVADLVASQRRLEDLFAESSAAGWPHPQPFGDTSYGPQGCPSHRLREIEMHHLDLGLGYTPASWPDEYVDWELEILLSTV